MMEIHRMLIDAISVVKDRGVFMELQLNVFLPSKDSYVIPNGNFTIRSVVDNIIDESLRHTLQFPDIRVLEEDGVLLAVNANFNNPDADMILLQFSRWSHTNTISLIPEDEKKGPFSHTFAVITHEDYFHECIRFIQLLYKLNNVDKCDVTIMKFIPGTKYPLVINPEGDEK